MYFVYRKWKPFHFRPTSHTTGEIFTFKDVVKQQREINAIQRRHKTLKDKAVPVQAWTGTEGSRSLRLPEFKTIDT